MGAERATVNSKVVLTNSVVDEVSQLAIVDRSVRMADRSVNSKTISRGLRRHGINGQQNMQTLIFCAFQPTYALVSLTTAIDQMYFVQPEVWQVKEHDREEHDRIGTQYSSEELSRAHWLKFFANLVMSTDDRDDLADFGKNF